MEANTDKFQFIILENTDLNTLQIVDKTTKSVSSVPLLGIMNQYHLLHNNSKSNFKEHINKIIK